MGNLNTYGTHHMVNRCGFLLNIEEEKKTYKIMFFFVFLLVFNYLIPAPLKSFSIAVNFPVDWNI